MAGLAKLSASALVLIGVNLIPILGALFAGWDVFTVVILYWFETAVIGAINVLRMLTAQGDMSGVAKRLIARAGKSDDPEQAAKIAKQVEAFSGKGNAMGVAKLFMVPFFCVHFGGFMLGHLVFIFVLLGGGMKMGGGGSPFSAVGMLPSLLSPMVIVSVLALLGSHLFSYFTNYIGRGEYRNTTAPEQMMRPYGRIVVMHVAIIFGGFATMLLGKGIGLLIILIAGKTLIDLKLHLRDHRKAEERGAAATAGAVFDLDARSD